MRSPQQDKHVMIAIIVYTMYHYLTMKITIRQWGNSLAVRIPKLFAVEMGIESGKEVELDLQDKSLIISAPENTLEDLLQKVTPENRHTETNTGFTKGLETW